MVSIEKFHLDLPTAAKICKKFNLDKPFEVNRFEKGMVNDVFVVDKKYVIKVKTGQTRIPRFQKESAVYGLLTEHHISSLKVFGYDGTKKLIPYSYFIMEYVPGKSLGDEWNKLKLNKKKAMLEKIGNLMAKIHSICFNEFGDRFEGNSFRGESAYNKYLHENVNAIAQKLRDSGALSNVKINKMERFFKSSKLFNVKVFPSLVHGNFIFDNMLIQKEEIKAVVDWEWAKAAHHEEEVATFLYRVLKMDNQLVKSFRKGYEKMFPLDSDFEERLYAYVLLYYLNVLPIVSTWSHRPDKQKEYVDETEKLFKRVIK